MNDKIFFFFYNFSHKFIFFDKVVVFTAETFPYIVMMLAGIFLLMHHEVFQAQNTFQVFMQKKKEILIAFFSGSLAWFLGYILKLLFHMPRPFDVWSHVDSLFFETGYAFPSGHATFFMALAVSLFFYHKKVGYIFIFFALLIGLSRIIAGVHYPVDILGGFVLGAIVAYLVAKFIRNV